MPQLQQSHHNLQNQKKMKNKNSNNICFFNNFFFFILFAFLTILIIPEIDIALSHLFYSQHTQNFALPHIPYINDLSKIIYIIITILMYKTYKDMRITFFLFACLTIGPGITVSALAKNVFERPRPSCIDTFGGDLEFKKPFQPRDFSKIERHKNQSFPSGHAARSFIFLAFAFIDKKNNKKIMLASTLFGILSGGVRIAQGGHFLSDVLFSGILIYLTCWVLHYLILKHRPQSLDKAY